MTTWNAGDPGTSDPAVGEWLKAHGFEADVVYRVDVEGDQLTVHRYHRDEEAGVHLHTHCPDREGGPLRKPVLWDAPEVSDEDHDICRLDPVTVKLQHPVPECLLTPA